MIREKASGEYPAGGVPIVPTSVTRVPHDESIRRDSQATMGHNGCMHTKPGGETLLSNMIDRRRFLRASLAGGAAIAAGTASARPAHAASRAKWEEAIQRGLEWLSSKQSSRGQWNTTVYPTAMAALSGTALIGSGST
ncbi:twin-arginine translocation signal domain-containing protein, partial [Rhodopirellula bahusiensis]